MQQWALDFSTNYKYYKLKTYCADHSHTAHEYPVHLRQQNAELASSGFMFYVLHCSKHYGKTNKTNDSSTVHCPHGSVHRIEDWP